MDKITKDDLEALQEGVPPLNEELLEYLTVPNEWLQVMKDYCLGKVIAQGGSKVKILQGSQATGKTHYLQDIRVHAQRKGFYVVYLDLMQVEFHITNSVELYRAIAREFDIELLADKLKHLLVEALGHSYEDFQGFGGNLTDYLCERENANPTTAKRDIRKAIHEIVKEMDIEFSFGKLMQMLMEAVAEKDKDFISIARAWLIGEKIERSYKVQSCLYETLTKSNARIWLYSLVEIIKLMGYTGVIIMFDHFEAILPNSEASVRYTPQKRNDVYELLRQLIDDLDFFRNILILIAGNNEILDNEKYGLQSYHALWMRIQPGFKQTFCFNPYADLIDANQIFSISIGQEGITALKDKVERLGNECLSSYFEHILISEDDITNFRDVIQKRLIRYKVGVSDDK